MLDNPTLGALTQALILLMRPSPPPSTAPPIHRWRPWPEQRASCRERVPASPITAPALKAKQNLTTAAVCGRVPRSAAQLLLEKVSEARDVHSNGSPAVRRDAVGVRSLAAWQRDDVHDLPSYFPRFGGGSLCRSSRRTE